MRKHKKGWILAGLIGALFIAGFIAMTITVNEAKNTIIQPIKLAEIEDGVYQGEYTITPVTVKLDVNVKDHQITNIRIREHIKGLGGKAEQIVNRIIDQQSLDVDSVSGATVSSQCILKAVELALPLK